jgi:hypothetical protein
MTDPQLARALELVARESVATTNGSPTP